MLEGVLRSCSRVRFFEIGGTGSFDVVRDGASTWLEVGGLRRGGRGWFVVVGGVRFDVLAEGDSTWLEGSRRRGWKFWWRLHLVV